MLTRLLTCLFNHVSLTAYHGGSLAEPRSFFRQGKRVPIMSLVIKTHFCGEKFNLLWLSPPSHVTQRKTPTSRHPPMIAALPMCIYITNLILDDLFSYLFTYLAT